MKKTRAPAGARSAY